MPVRLSRAERNAIREAVEAAEEGHRAEIRVHLEDRYPGDGPLGRAGALFIEMGMDRTRDSTGVLLYVAEKDRKVAVYAGAGVYGARDPQQWKAISNAVADGYRAGDRIAGIRRGLELLRDVLVEAAPGEDTAGDELPNEVNVG
jgi:uncharacterized membrane protein